MSRDAHGAPYETENEKRRGRAFRHALIFAHEQNGDEDIETAIYDLMADLLHLCDDYGIEQDDAQRIARHHYNAELHEAEGVSA